MPYKFNETACPSWNKIIDRSELLATGKGLRIYNVENSIVVKLYRIADFKRRRDWSRFFKNRTNSGRDDLCRQKELRTQPLTEWDRLRTQLINIKRLACYFNDTTETIATNASDNSYDSIDVSSKMTQFNLAGVISIAELHDEDELDDDLHVAVLYEYMSGGPSLTFKTLTTDSVHLLLPDNNNVDPCHYPCLAKGTTIIMPISEQRCKTWVANILRALSQLHRFNFSHNDVKPSNILIDNEIAYLADLEEMTEIDEMGRSTQTDELGCIKGTHYFYSPELVKNAGLTDLRRNDLWALGVSLWLWLFGRLPYRFDNNGVFDIFENISKFSIEKSFSTKIEFVINQDIGTCSKHLRDLVTPECQDFLKLILGQKFTSTETLQKHPWLLAQ